MVLLYFTDYYAQHWPLRGAREGGKTKEKPFYTVSAKCEIPHHDFFFPTEKECVYVLFILHISSPVASHRDHIFFSLQVKYSFWTPSMRNEDVCARCLNC